MYISIYTYIHILLTFILSASIIICMYKSKATHTCTSYTILFSYRSTYPWLKRCYWVDKQVIMDLTFSGFLFVTTVCLYSSLYILGVKFQPPGLFLVGFLGPKFQTRLEDNIRRYTMFLEINILNLLTLLSFDTVDGKNPAPPGMVLKPVVNNRIFNYQPQLVNAGFLPSTVWLFTQGMATKNHRCPECWIEEIRLRDIGASVFFSAPEKWRFGR